METINDRIESLVNEKFNGNKAAFASSIGLGPTALSNYLGNKRRSKPSVDMVAKIVKSLDVDARWLLTGERGDAATASGDGSVAVSGGNTNSPITTNAGGESALLRERVALLEALLAEKERLIKVYEKMMEGRK